MAKKARRIDAANGETRKQRRGLQLVRHRVTPQNRARALLRLHELQRHYNEVGERTKAKMPPGSFADENDEELQTDLLDLAATKQAIRKLAADLGVRPGEKTEDTLTLIGEALDGSHRQGKRREQKPTEMR